MDLTYTATATCVCGAGLAHGEDDTSWTCSAVLLGDQSYEPEHPLEGTLEEPVPPVVIVEHISPLSIHWHPEIAAEKGKTTTRT